MSIVYLTFVFFGKIKMAQKHTVLYHVLSLCGEHIWTDVWLQCALTKLVLLKVNVSFTVIVSNIEAEDTVTFIKDSNSSLGSNCNSVCFFILS